jgi:hypothetical protein
MNARRSCFFFAAVLLSVVAGPSGLAQDASVNTQIAKIKRSLPTDNGRAVDLKGLKAATSSLTQILPSSLEALPPDDEHKEYEVDSVTSDKAYTPRLALSEHQRLALLNAYQDYAENIAAIARSNPFDQQAAEQIKGAVAALQQFMTKLKELLLMDRNSDEYKSAVESLVHDVQHKSK